MDHTLTLLRLADLLPVMGAPLTIIGGLLWARPRIRDMRSSYRAYRGDDA